MIAYVDNSVLIPLVAGIGRLVGAEPILANYAGNRRLTSPLSLACSGEKAQQSPDARRHRHPRMITGSIATHLIHEHGRETNPHMRDELSRWKQLGSQETPASCPDAQGHDGIGISVAGART